MLQPVELMRFVTLCTFWYVLVRLNYVLVRLDSFEYVLVRLGAFWHVLARFGAVCRVLFRSKQCFASF